MEKVLQDLHDAKQQILNFTDGRHYKVVDAITAAEEYIKFLEKGIESVSTGKELAKDLMCLCMLAVQSESNSVTIPLETAGAIIDILSGEKIE